MNLTDELKQMQESGKQVISITYILRRLESPQIDLNTKLEQRPAEDKQAV